MYINYNWSTYEGNLQKSTSFGQLTSIESFNTIVLVIISWLHKIHGYIFSSDDNFIQLSNIIPSFLGVR
jgi:hypothetical protein